MARKLLKGLRTKGKLAFILTLFMSLSVFAQDVISVSGNVTMASLGDEPAAGVSVIIKGTATGTVTDFDGNYTIEVAPGDILEFQYLGFKTETVIITDQKTINISLQDDTQSLEEVVVVGYGTQKKKNLTGSVSKVGGAKLQKASVARVDEALVGRVTGVQIAASNTEAGGDTEIKIRGVGSISGSSDPLIVVDGIPLGTDNDILGTIDTNTIKSVDILKDASSTAIYGSRGANGVILITLKDGVEGKNTFSYDTYFGVKWVPHNDKYSKTWAEHKEFLDSSYAALGDSANDVEIAGQIEQSYAEWYAGQAIVDAAGGETDWQETIMPGGTISSHAFSATGGTKQVKYAASLGYLHDEGVFLEDDFEKYNARLKITNTSKNGKVKTGISLGGTYTKQQRISDLHSKLSQMPWLPTYITEDLLPYINTVDFPDVQVGDYAYEAMFNNVFFTDGSNIAYNDDGTPVAVNDDTGDIAIFTTNNPNPLANALERERYKYQTSYRANAFADFKLAKGLKFRQNLIADTRFTNSTVNTSTLYHRLGSLRTERDEQMDERVHYGAESLLTYKRDIKKHTIDAVAGFGYEKWNYKRFSSETGQYTDDATDVILLGAPSTDVFSLRGEESLVSVFGRINYDYDDKYLISLSARTDGSSRFGENTKYGYFPAGSIGWRVSNENFLVNSDVITDLKLRASYGVSGSREISRDVFESLYRYQSTLSAVAYGDESGVLATTIGNPNLSWERLIEFNPGLDLELWNGALGVTFDYFTRTSDDLILDKPIGSAFGIATSLENIGEVVNTGYELELRSKVFNGNNFSWDVAAMASTVENEVTDFGGIDQLINRIENAKRPSEFITQVGGPISAFYGYVYDSEVPLNAADVGGAGVFERPNSVPQSVYVKDLNGDGLIDSDDRAVIGDPYPDITWSLSNNFDIYNFDLSFILQGSHGAQVRVADLEYIRHEDNNVVSTTKIDQLYADGNAKYDSSYLKNRLLTSDHIQDASFVALRNVNIGYSFSDQLIEKLKLEKLRLYLSGENLVYLMADEYVGFNPESNTWTSDNANTPVTYGVQRSSTPVSRTISLGLNVQF